MLEDNKYPNFIERGVNKYNDAIFDYLKPKIHGKWLDIGCNTGTMLSEVTGGVGIDSGRDVVNRAREKGLDVYHGDACYLPFNNEEFDTVVMSCVLEQITRWQDALDEAIRVCKVGGKVIGINPIPDSPIWGVIGGTEWVKSTIEPDDLKHYYQARIVYPSLKDKYYFEIDKR